MKNEKKNAPAIAEQSTQQEQSNANCNSSKQDNYNKPAAENQEVKASKIIEFIEKAMQCTDKQFDKFCRRMQEEFSNASTEDYTTMLHIICLLDALRSKKGA